jgi:hypothetical protein
VNRLEPRPRQRDFLAEARAHFAGIAVIALDRPDRKAAITEGPVNVCCCIRGL